MLQTVAPPKDLDEWGELYDDPPGAAELKKLFEKVTDAFYLWGDPGLSNEKVRGPAFMQDFDKRPEARKNQNCVSHLFIDMPGENAVKKNTDFFIKRGGIQEICPACAATALFTFQINAPAGGAGNRVGLRGGGPLTTLVRPEKIKTSLWEKLWLNILTEESFAESIKTTEPKVFPWLAPTRCSDKKGGPTLPEDMHPLHAYWGMPRRIWLIGDNPKTGHCDVCGMASADMVNQYASINYGFDFGDTWLHPLTPYKFDAKKKQPPLSIKGQKGGLSYKNWFGVALNNIQDGTCCAAVVNEYFQKTQENDLSGQAGIWCFGYDMDKMKARCWYEHEFPFFAMDGLSLARFRPMVEKLLAFSMEGLKILKFQIKSAWFSRPGDAKGDLSMIDATFLDRTEPLFYKLTARLSIIDFTQRGTLPGELAAYGQWVSFLRRTMVDIFDSMVLEGDTDTLDMKRIVIARQALLRRIKTVKIFKEIDKALDEGLKETGSNESKIKFQGEA